MEQHISSTTKKSIENHVSATVVNFQTFWQHDDVINNAGKQTSSDKMWFKDIYPVDSSCGDFRFDHDLLVTRQTYFVFVHNKLLIVKVEILLQK